MVETSPIHTSIQLFLLPIAWPKPCSLLRKVFHDLVPIHITPPQCPALSLMTFPSGSSPKYNMDQLHCCTCCFLHGDRFQAFPFISPSSPILKLCIKTFLSSFHLLAPRLSEMLIFFIFIDPYSSPIIKYFILDCD